MTSFLLEQLTFYLTIPIIFFVPGYFLLLAVFGKKTFSQLEKFAFAFTSSILAIDFLMIFIGRLHIPINRISLLLGIILFCVICFYIYHKKQEIIFHKKTEPENHFSKHELFAILTILLLTIFIKTTYLSNAILPTSTDLGHHMYWTKTIKESGQLPKYEEFDVTENGTISELEPIADFIIGEHLVFSATSLISGLDVVSYFPVLILYLIHIFGIITLFLLTLLIFKDNTHQNLISIMTLFLIGPVYALSSPQLKFISGGVIGNTIGNLLIPFVIYFFVRALSEKNSKFLAFAFFAALGMAYTHHLSTFIFIFITFFTLIFFTIFNFKQIIPYLRDWTKLFLKPEVLAIIMGGLIFIFIFYTPTYLNVKAVDTAVGAPSKSTRMGLTFTQLKFTTGEARFLLGLIGILILFIKRKSLQYGTIFLLSWGVSILVMSLRPNWLLIDIPSNRIASYIVFPMAILASYAFVVILTNLKNSRDQYLNNSFTLASFLILMSFITTGGFRDNSQTLNIDSAPQKTLQTYHASAYLEKKTDASDMILKDHNYISADSWVKIYLMRGYNYPLSRGYFKRYEDETKKREQCTLLMISKPQTTEAEQCFSGTKTNFLMLNPKYDATQFQKAPEFWQVYAADNIAVFYKKN